MVKVTCLLQGLVLTVVLTGILYVPELKGATMNGGQESSTSPAQVNQVQASHEASSTATTSSGSSFYTVTPCRVYDSRRFEREAGCPVAFQMPDGEWGTRGCPQLGNLSCSCTWVEKDGKLEPRTLPGPYARHEMLAGWVYQAPMVARCGVPVGARAVAVNVTVVSPSSPGSLFAMMDKSRPGDETNMVMFLLEAYDWQGGRVRNVPNGEMRNFKGATKARWLIQELDENGEFSFMTNTYGGPQASGGDGYHFLVDVMGYFM